MTTPRFHRRHLAALVLAGLVLGACGAGSDDAASAPTTPDETPTPDEITLPDTNEWQRVASRADLTNLQLTEPSEVVTDPTNDRVLLVRHENASEPCSGAMVEATETADSITISLYVGLDPNVAAMTCVAGVFPYEIAVDLDSSVGDRIISIAG